MSPEELDSFLSFDASPLFSEPMLDSTTPLTSSAESPLFSDDFESILSGSPAGVLDLFDNAAYDTFTSMFPDATPSPPVKTAPFDSPMAAPPLSMFPALTVPTVSPSDSLLASFATGGVAAASKLNLTPEDAAALLASAERSISSKYPHLMPAVERLRASLHMAAASPAVKTATVPPPTPMTPSTSPLLMYGAGTGVDSFAVPWNTAPPPTYNFNPIISQLPSPSLAGSDSAEPFVKPKAKVGRKRKERPNDSAALLAELDLKRQRNTEAARRSRVRRLAEQDSLNNALSEALRGKEAAEEKVRALEKRVKALEGLLAKNGLVK